MPKKICKVDKKKLSKDQSGAKYECKSCGAESVKEKQLCKPKKI